MIRDSRELKQDQTLDADLCVIGAGAAGITICNELIGTSVQVILLESGGLQYDPEIQSLYAGEVIGYPAPPLTSSRLRYFGGTTNHWAGTCTPLDPIDFEARSWVPYSGWPFDRAHLDPYYKRAQRYCGLGSFGYDSEFWQSLTGFRPLPLDDDRIDSPILQLSPPTRFGKEYEPSIRKAENVVAYLYANGLEIVADRDGANIINLRVGCLTGLRFNIKAKYYVLATGGIENARMLLVSNAVHQTGLGNRHGLVGRFFMDHLIVRTGMIVLSEPGTNVDYYDVDAQIKGVRGIGAMRLADQHLRREKLLNNILTLGVNYTNENYRNADIKTPGTYAFISIVKSLAQGQLPNDFGGKSCRTIDDIDTVITFLKRRLMRTIQSKGEVANILVKYEAEQAPNPRSRVNLHHSKRDQLGLPQAQLDWQLSDFDKFSIRRTAELIGIELGRAGLGRFRTDIDEELSKFPEVETAWHHMGTTRMSENDKTGVVDSACRVHGLSNLYVAGSSVFPTGGRANPTLTIVALAIRLADHLKSVAR